MTKPTNFPTMNQPTKAQIQAMLKEMKERALKQHSVFWLGEEIIEDLMERLEEGSIDYLERLRGMQRGIGNFVRIVTGKEIPVTYSSGEQSYTDGKSVVISADIQPDKLDSMAGLALHEATHVAESQMLFEFLSDMNAKFEIMVNNTKLPALAMKLGITKDITGASGKTLKAVDFDKVKEHVHRMMNFLEDRRIDLIQYQRSPGYQAYYDALYNEHFYSPFIDKALQSNEYREPTVENYDMFIINMMNKHFDSTALPKLDEIRKITDMSESGLLARGNDDRGYKTYKHALAATNVDISRFPKIFQDAVRMVEIMYENAKSVQNPQQKPQSGQGQPNDMKPGDLPNMDQVPQSEVRKALDKQRAFLKGKVEKKEVSQEVKQDLEQMEKTKAQIMEVEGDFLPKNVKAKVIVYRNITKKVMESNSFPFASRAGWGRTAGLTQNTYMVNALNNGIRMGQILAHRIRVMQDEKPLTYNHQQQGRLDKRRIAGLGFGIQDVFAITHIEKTKPANIWLDIDFSGSMSGDKAQSAMTLAVAIAYASEKTRTLNCVIALRDGDGEAARIAIIYNSRTQSFKSLRSIVPYLEVCGGTPESLCYEAVREEMARMFKDERKFFVNFSDGMPGHGFQYKGQYYSYGGDSAARHCRQIMNEFRAMGIEILSYYIGHSGGGEYAPFRALYGNDARFIDPKSITQVSSTLNKMLMKGKKEG